MSANHLIELTVLEALACGGALAVLSTSVMVMGHSSPGALVLLASGSLLVAAGTLAARLCGSRAADAVTQSPS